MRKSNFALRLQPSLLEEARKLAESEGVALNRLINVAVAEKLSALRTEEYFSQRAARRNLPKALRILKRAGVATRRSNVTNCRRSGGGDRFIPIVVACDRSTVLCRGLSRPCRRLTRFASLRLAWPARGLE
jgi:hypothetical protein